MGKKGCVLYIYVRSRSAARLRTRIDTIKLRLCPTYSNTRSTLFQPSSEPLSELPASPTTNIRTTSPGLLTPTTCRIAMMIAAKNGTVTTTIAAMTTVQKAQAPSNFINADQITPYATDQMFCPKLSHALIFF